MGTVVGAGRCTVVVERGAVVVVRGRDADVVVVTAVVDVVVAGSVVGAGRVISTPSTDTLVVAGVMVPPDPSAPGHQPERLATTTSADAAHSHQNHRPSRITHGGT